MTLKTLEIKIHGPKRDERGRMDNEAPSRPTLVHAPPLVPQADAAPPVEEPKVVEEAMSAPEPPSPRDVADAVYGMFVEDARRSRIRRGT